MCKGIKWATPLQHLNIPVPLHTSLRCIDVGHQPATSHLCTNYAVQQFLAWLLSALSSWVLQTIVKQNILINVHWRLSLGRRVFQARVDASAQNRESGMDGSITRGLPDWWAVWLIMDSSHELFKELHLFYCPLVSRDRTGCQLSLIHIWRCRRRG